MKTLLLVAASATVLFTGCASTPRNDTTAYDDNVDFRKVAAIDHVARVRGVTVKWVNYPQKKSPAVGVVPAMDPTGT